MSQPAERLSSAPVHLHVPVFTDSALLHPAHVSVYQAPWTACLNPKIFCGVNAIRGTLLERERGLSVSKESGAGLKKVKELHLTL